MIREITPFGTGLSGIVYTLPWSPPWIDADVKTLCLKKDVASRKALRTKDQLHINKFKSLRRDVKKLIRTKYNAYIKKLADNVGISTAVKPRLISFLLPLRET